MVVDKSVYNYIMNIKQQNIKKEYQKKYRQKNKEKIAKYLKDNCKKIAKRQKKYNQDNAEQIARYKSNYRRERIKCDINFRLICNLRSRLCEAIRNNQKSGSAIHDLGCTIEEFKIYISGLFAEGMSWENYGRKKGVICWHIDHIIPLSKFDLTNREQLLQACHYTNMQPLWAIDNIKKSNKRV